MSNKIWNEVKERFCLDVHEKKFTREELIEMTCFVIDERLAKLEVQADHPAAFLLKPWNEDIAKDVTSERELVSMFSGSLSEAACEAHNCYIEIDNRRGGERQLEDTEYYINRALRILAEIKRRREKKEPGDGE